MAKLIPEVVWIYNPNFWDREYGIACLAGRWAVVKTNGRYVGDQEDFDILTEWFPDRNMAVGFVKLLLEK